MYLAIKECINLTQEQAIILGHMGYNAVKLWNVASYEKRNWQNLKMPKYPNWFEQKKRLKSHLFYKNLPSQTAQALLGELEEAWKSYFALKKSGKIENPKPPRFKKGKTAVTFVQNAIKLMPDGIVRLAVSKQLKAYLEKEKKIKADYVYLQIKSFANLKIKEIRIQFNTDNTITAIAVHQIPDIKEKFNNGNYLSIDPGINRNFTCFNNVTGDCFIVNAFLNVSHWFDKEIARLQELNAPAQLAKGIKYPKPSKRVLSLYKKKRNSLKDFLHKSSRYIVDYCIAHNINTIIIGDWKNIRKDKNFGRTNQQLHAFPFDQFYNMLDYKCKMAGIRFVKTEESYTSRCAPTSLIVSRQHAKKSNRKKRGLYKTHGITYNADCVGAYNILRKYLYKNCTKAPGFKNLSSPVKVKIMGTNYRVPQKKYLCNI